MTKSRAVRYFLCFALLFAIVGGLAGNQVVYAQQSGQQENTVKLACDFPALRGKSGESFEFTVSINWWGAEAKRFELTITAPPKWAASVGRAYPEVDVAAIQLKAWQDYPESLYVKFGPALWHQPEPGEYIVTLEATSGDIKASIELKAVVTAIYEFSMVTATGKLNAEVTAGKDNPLSIVLINTGTAAIENITFSSAKLEGWSITFSPEKVDSLEPGLRQEVNVVIKPPRGKTIAGDYNIYLRAESKDYEPDALKIRVTVLTPTIWGWVSILVVLMVIAGLGVLFWRLGRR